MDIATPIGILVALGLVAFGIGGGIASFVNVPSIMIVVGGTIGALLVSYPLGDVLKIFGVALKTFIHKMPAAEEVIGQLVEFSQLVRKEGILTLESRVDGISISFMARGVQMAIDGREPGEIEDILYMEMDKLRDRHAKGAELLTQVGTLAPAMGMIGTLIGLVLMLQNMSDPSTIGPSMAVALITTFYGALIANVFAIPMASKLRIRSKDEQLLYEVIVTGVRSLVSGENPRSLEAKLLAFLPPNRRKPTLE